MCLGVGSLEGGLNLYQAKFADNHAHGKGTKNQNC